MTTVKQGAVFTPVELPPEAPASHFRVTSAAGGVSVTRYTGPGGRVNIPAVINGQAVRSIGRDAFQKCTDLEEVYIPASVGHIGEWAFAGCEYLRVLCLPEGLTCIDSFAFNGCSALQSVEIPVSVEKLGWNIFCSCRQLNTLRVAAENPAFVSVGGVLFSRRGELVCYPAGRKSPEYTIPDFVTKIGPFSLSGCKTLRELYVPSNVLRIEPGAFDYCSRLKLMVLPGSVAHSYAEKNNLYFELNSWSLSADKVHELYTWPQHFEISMCQDGVRIEKYIGQDTRVHIPSFFRGKPVVEIAYGAFAGCTHVTEVVLPDGVTRIGDYAFQECSGLRSIRIPDGTVSIGYGAFDRCSELRSVRIPDGVSIIEDSCFSGCKMLAEVKFPANMTSIGKFAFWCCEVLDDVRFPSTLTHIGECAFNACREMSTIHIPAGVTHIGRAAFSDCWNLQSLTVDEENSVYWAPDNVLFNRDGVLLCYPGGRMDRKYTVPEGTRCIAADAFYRCEKLTEVYVPATVKEIGNCAFWACGRLKRLELPSSRPIMGKSAFAGCPLPWKQRLGFLLKSLGL